MSLLNKSGAMRRIAKIAAVVALGAVVTGCCVSPFGFGHGHYRGHFQGSNH